MISYRSGLVEGRQAEVNERQATNMMGQTISHTACSTNWESCQSFTRVCLLGPVRFSHNKSIATHDVFLKAALTQVSEGCYNKRNESKTIAHILPERIPEWMFPT